MSMLLLLMITLYLMTQISSEILIIGVGLLAIRSEIEHNAGCALLQKQAAWEWRGGGFISCISLPPLFIGLDRQIIPYRIAVNSKSFYNYPVHRHYIEQYAFINKKLNAPGKQCVTITGPNWWDQQLVRNMIYDFQMFYTSHLETLHPPICNALSTSTLDNSAFWKLLNCTSNPLEKTGKQRTHQIQLTVHVSSYNMLLSESMHVSAEQITGRMNLLSDHCVFVAGVSKSGFGPSVVMDIQLQFKGDSFATNSCFAFIESRRDAYIIGGILTCESDVISDVRIDWITNAVRLRVQGSLNGFPLNLMSNSEVALRVEALFNHNKLGCITFEPRYTAKRVKKLSYISGPSSADLCKQVERKMGANFYKFYKSCVEDLVQPYANWLSSYRLESIEPFYELDESLYLETHAQLVYDCNIPYLSCECNGYIQSEQSLDHQPDGHN